MISGFKFGRGLTNPCKDLLNDYILADIEFSRRMHESILGQRPVFTAHQIQTVRPDASANILMGTPSGLIPSMNGEPYFTRKMKRSI